ncbi:MAG: hypothetical protein V3W41_11590, partial [Planctomycetota bacterium]
RRVFDSDPGTVYVVAGSSGQLNSNAVLDHPIMVENAISLGSLIIDVRDDQMDIRFLENYGFVRDHLTLMKGRTSAIRNPSTT